MFAAILPLVHACFSISPILVLSPHSWQHHKVNRAHFCHVCYMQLLFAFSLTIIQVFRSLGNKRPESLMAMEDHILSAAMKLSHGEDLVTTMSCLHDGIKASEDALSHDVQACNWFCLTKPTDCLNVQPSPSSHTEEFDHSSLSQNPFKNLVGDKNTVGLASPPCSPKGLPSAPRFPIADCIDPQLLHLGGLSLDEDLMAEDMDPSDGSGDDSGGENKEDGDVMRVEDAQEDQVEEDHTEEGQENKVKSMCLSNIRHIKGLIICSAGMRVDHSYDFDSDLTSEEESEQEQEQEQEEDKKEQDSEEEHAQQEDAVEEDVVEEDAVEEDAVEEDQEQENREDAEQVNMLSLRRSARLQTKTPNPVPSHEHLASTEKQPGGSTIKSKPSRTRPNLLEEAIGNASKSKPSRTWPNLLDEAVGVQIAS
jgi:hypothetical protein